MSRPSVQIIYIPGLGDGYHGFRTRALRRWTSRDVQATIVQMAWRDRSETFEQKQRRVQQAIRNTTAERVVLVGESAGGSMAVAETLRSASRVDKCITICGKNVRADRVSPRLYLRNPAFRGSMNAADNAVASMDAEKDGQKFIVFYSPHDPVVWLVDTKLPGASLKKIPMVGHFLSIAFVLYVYKHTIIKAARS